jgi:hypothetical protein
MIRSTIPPISNPAAMGPNSSDLNPACRSTASPGVASAFITTTDQAPGWMFQSSSC